MQVLNIKRKHYTKDEYFPKQILFTIIYLLQEKKLNHNKKSEQELNMSNFVQANEYACQGSMYEHALIFVNKFFKFCNLRSLYNAIMHKKGFGQAYCKALLFSVFFI
jgi:hypothetical protein